jgi:hypothetical protein
VSAQREGDFRHTFASLLIQQGVNPKYIQQQLGHGSISITLDIYSHLFQGDHRHHIHQLDDPQEPREQVVKSTESVTQAQPQEVEPKAGSWEPIDASKEILERRGDGAAERAGLENRRPFTGSASSNLAPSAMFQWVAGTFNQNWLMILRNRNRLCNFSHRL